MNKFFVLLTIIAAAPVFAKDVAKKEAARLPASTGDYLCMHKIPRQSERGVDYTNIVDARNLQNALNGFCDSSKPHSVVNREPEDPNDSRYLVCCVAK